MPWRSTRRGPSRVIDMTEFPAAPALAGVHRLTIPVSDMAASVAWYRTRLGYRSMVELVDGGELTAVRMRHPAGGPELALRVDPERAAMAAGFDSFVFGVPGKQAIDEFARHLTDLGEDHGGVHLAPGGWVLPLLHDPDGRELRFTATEPAAQRPNGHVGDPAAISAPHAADAKRAVSRP